jgi:hypothetical protein
MEIVLVLLVLVLGASLYVNYNLYKKYETLEETAQQNEQFLLAIRNRVMNKVSDLKQIDRRGSFESDDEVGHFFKELKKIIMDIASFVEIENDEFEQSTERVMSARSTITSEF